MSDDFGNLIGLMGLMSAFNSTNEEDKEDEPITYNVLFKPPHETEYGYVR
jgi:hypothetical protein